jgi:Tfp pilus assembly protein PilE
MKKQNSSGFTMIVLIIAILIVAILSAYSINKLYFKQSEKNLKENGLMESDINQSPTLQNAQTQVDRVRNRVNEIQDEQNKKINDLLPN